MRQTVFEETTDGITIDRVIRDYEYTMPTKHFHDEYEIYYLLEGKRLYFIGQNTYLIGKGTMVFINKNVIHKTGLASGPYHDRILIEFAGEPFGSFYSFFGDLSLEAFFEKHQGIMEFDERERNHVENLLLGIQSEIHHKKPGYRLAVMNRLASLLIFAHRHAEDGQSTHSSLPKNPKHQKVDDVAKYIATNCTSPLSLESVADTFFVNKCYLSRIFKEITGFTINEYINVHRIQKAQELLSSTDMSVTDIASECGYESLTYFEKVFKTYREITPLKYRSEYKHRMKRRTSLVKTDTP
ncbi:MAG: AraC family transcriptional regulator [Lachnospiraceae bacterium]|jgi:AraC-like DNA-binding protein|nr:helix-turn-helix transcriptional regulator [Lachnospiraceae bacterium]MCR5428331.1 AraC family transcriptional regulator [Lachnospiraceae bacterium]